MATFVSDFYKTTGKEFDRNEFLSNATYRSQNKKAIQQSAAVADANYSQIAGSTTQAGSRRFALPQGKVSRALGLEDVSANSLGGGMITFFTNYPFRETEQWAKSARGVVDVLLDKQYDKSELLKLALPVVGTFLGGMTYQYLQALSYNVKQILTGGDDEEEKAEKELERLTSPKGMLTESLAAVSSIASTRYGALSKAAIQLLGTIAYNFSDDEETKQTAKAITRELTFKNPLAINKKKNGEISTYGLSGELAKEITSYIPPLAVLTTNTLNAIESYGGIPYLYEKIENGEALSEPEKDAIISLQILVNTSNAILMFKGGGFSANEINNYVRNIKKAEKDSKSQSSTESRQSQTKQVQSKTVQTKQVTTKQIE
jgi:hypothetical protein